ncbi:MAG: hypothetical protein U0521_05160 [Anaerolineae bacterium]
MFAARHRGIGLAGDQRVEVDGFFFLAAFFAELALVFGEGDSRVLKQRRSLRVQLALGAFGILEAVEGAASLPSTATSPSCIQAQ